MTGVRSYCNCARRTRFHRAHVAQGHVGVDGAHDPLQRRAEGRVGRLRPRDQEEVVVDRAVAVRVVDGALLLAFAECDLLGGPHTRAEFQVTGPSLQADRHTSRTRILLV